MGIGPQDVGPEHGGWQLPGPLEEMGQKLVGLG